MTYSIIQAVTNNYDKIYDCLDSDATNRILFTDTQANVANWDHHLITPNVQCPWEDIFNFRWHPFAYTNSDYVIWIDGSIKITGSLKQYIDAMETGHYDFATIKHPMRDTIWDEYCAWITTRNYPMEKAFTWMACMERAGWDPNNLGLYQVNVCIFKNTPIVKEFGETVWSMLHSFDKEHAERLDQTIATYVLKHIYKDRISVLPLSESIYKTGPSMKIHGSHPNK